MLCLKGTKTPDHVHLFSRTQNLKYVKLYKRVVREKTTRVISRVGDGVNCPVHLRRQRTYPTETRWILRRQSINRIVSIILDIIIIITISQVELYTLFTINTTLYNSKWEVLSCRSFFHISEELINLIPINIINFNQSMLYNFFFHKRS